MVEQTRSSSDSVLGRLVVERGLASNDEVEACLRDQRQGNEDSDVSGRSLGEVLIERGMVTASQLSRLRPIVEAETSTSQQQIPGYQILRKLGAGAMATVYLARQISLDRRVAIKVLPQKFTSSPEFVERFYAEGRAAAKLNHPNIVQAYDVGQAGEFHYFVMEYVEGHTVFDVLTTRGRYDETEALNVIIQVAKALEHAHQQGFIHRDVKPKNIMITRDGTVKLADMGLARAVSDREAAEQEAGKAYGTPYYISPEQIRGEVDVDFRCDIYGLGATLYHMVTGRVPFDGPNPSAVMHQHLKTPLTPPDHINAELSAGLGEIIEVCMAKKRSRRYRTTADLLADLLAVQSGEPPLQARRAFDLASLAKLEDTQVQVDGAQMREAAPGTRPILEQPLFWIAAAGWCFFFLALLFAVLK